jgi:hypothetical protein
MPDPPEDALESAQKRLLNAFEATLGEAWRSCRYEPHLFAGMLRDYGAVDTAKRLLRPGEDPQYGLFRLAECGRLDLSVEAIVLKEEFAPLFTSAELTEARRRLGQFNYAPPWLR